MTVAAGTAPSRGRPAGLGGTAERCGKWGTVAVTVDGAEEDSGRAVVNVDVAKEVAQGRGRGHVWRMMGRRGNGVGIY